MHISNSQGNIRDLVKLRDKDWMQTEASLVEELVKGEIAAEKYGVMTLQDLRKAFYN